MKLSRHSTRPAQCATVEKATGRAVIPVRPPRPLYASTTVDAIMQPAQLVRAFRAPRTVHGWRGASYPAACHREQLAGDEGWVRCSRSPHPTVLFSPPHAGYITCADVFGVNESLELLLLPHTRTPVQVSFWRIPLTDECRRRRGTVLTQQLIALHHHVGLNSGRCATSDVAAPADVN